MRNAYLFDSIPGAVIVNLQAYRAGISINASKLQTPFEGDRPWEILSQNTATHAQRSPLPRLPVFCVWSSAQALQLSRPSLSLPVFAFQRPNIYICSNLNQNVKRFIAFGCFRKNPPHSVCIPGVHALGSRIFTSCYRFVFPITAHY